MTTNDQESSQYSQPGLGVSTAEEWDRVAPGLFAKIKQGEQEVDEINQQWHCNALWILNYILLGSPGYAEDVALEEPDAERRAEISNLHSIFTSLIKDGHSVSEALELLVFAGWPKVLGVESLEIKA